MHGLLIHENLGGKIVIFMHQTFPTGNKHIPIQNVLFYTFDNNYGIQNHFSKYIEGELLVVFLIPFFKYFPKYLLLVRYHQNVVFGALSIMS